MKNKHTTSRSFPGRLKLEEWLALPFSGRLDLAQRAQCELLACHLLCAGKECRRHRTCCGDDATACKQDLWQRTGWRPKVLRRELSRLDDLARLPGPDVGALHGESAPGLTSFQTSRQAPGFAAFRAGGDAEASSLPPWETVQPVGPEEGSGEGG